MPVVVSVILVILLIAVVLGEVLLLLLRCRHGHPQIKLLGLWRYAHRGLHNKPQIPENSMAAFRRAIDQKYGAELDVHLMKDGNLAVIHDASLLRTAGVDVQIEDLTKEELGQYRLEGTDEKIPLFEEVLALFEGKMPLIVELKSERNNYTELTEAAVAMLDRFDVQYCIESFDPRCLMWLKKKRPNIVRGQLSEQFLKHGETPKSKPTMFILANLLMNFLTQPDFIAYNYVDRECLVVQICRRFFKVQEVNWTIRSKEDMISAEKEGNIVIFECFDPRG